MAKLEYNKPAGDKILIRGGPRDMQRRQQLKEQEQIIRSLVKEEDKGPRPTMRGEKEAPQAPTIDLSQYLPLDEVRTKLEQAVDYTRNEEKGRYESGLKNLNEQLKEARKRAALADEQLINANAEVRRLKNQIAEIPTSSSADLEKIKSLTIEVQNLTREVESKQRVGLELSATVRTVQDLLKIKDEEIVNFRLRVAELEQTLKFKEESGNEIKGLQEKLDKLYLKIADGSISPLVGSRMDRPALEDKIFIDPIDKGQEPKLESHIEVEGTSTMEIDRDVSSDLAKLRNLLKI